MREIKFRGYCDRDSEWRYGFYISDGKYHEILTLITKSGELYGSPVDPETVGQYTGIKDNNGVDIYEGDIVNHGGIGVGFIEYRNNQAAFKIVFAGTTRKWFVDVLDSEFKLIEVIGNIHDNPELLERAE